MASLEEDEGASNDNSNQMEVDRDSNASSPQQEEESSDSSSDDEAEQDQNIAILEQKISQNPYDYSANVELINTLRKAGDLDKLREARERMSQHFPLSPELWKAWLEDENKLATTVEERTTVKDLFERAVKDYVSVELWLEYVQFSIGFMGDQNGMDNVRAVFERALTAAGLHVSKGVVLWEAYREFEQCMLTMIEANADASDEDKEVQKRKLDSLFRRQLSVPLLEMERAYEEYVSWIGGGSREGQNGLDENVNRVYKKALEKLGKVLPFEMQLMSTPESRTDVYREYLDYEKGDGEPARVQCLYERALAELCLDPVLWLDYLKYVDTQLKIDSIVLSVCERAVRNCPWSAPLWVYYLRILERYKHPHQKLTEVMEQALGVGFSTAAEYRGLWMAYLDYLRRRVKWGEDEEEEQLKELRAAFNRACEHLAQFFGLQGDPTCMVLQAWARMEAVHAREMETTRRLWSDILSQGHDKTASMWLEYINLEKCYGDTKHLRRLYQRALAATQDWPESIGDAWLNFERDEGTLETFEACESKYEARMKAVLELREKQEAQQAAQQAESAAAHKGHRHDASKRKRDDVSRWAALAGQSVTVKRVPGSKLPSKPEGAKGNGEPTPSVSDADEPSKKKPRNESHTSGDHGVKVEHDPSKDNQTVFVSNLEYSTTEEQIRELFAPIGTITDLRLVKDFKGRSKGYCYVVYSSPAEAAEALKKDRESLAGRPVFVSKCDANKLKRQPVFKYSNELEKNKLFIRGLPLTTTKEELEDLFKSFGVLKDVRIVTYRNGHSKGLAYVEFVDEVNNIMFTWSL
ncbi:hypothetical protein R5R35_007795 [Gryllus longicercus]|uniref:RRM domain-containing protein n=1 Tax=Gryllus longicercus TaxID=2509291 RepID=A0AAN9ZJ52_9ORTH